ncbi:BamA/TamA family outer membrane protein [Synechococcus sp. PROS-U-1]|uniref:BamA/TamA family outer membrane protein n=1 Tax=Synechococcus sp. PROS-U-1 TaxID=1400866 RepID=UPI00164402A5|nr:BamA/TamA family outer membrane protein [Synechococcus sp. PROS-U-1]QNJ04151.1 outer membrane protein insertion porin family [Synechococcus sp. PROS-U-1]
MTRSSSRRSSVAVRRTVLGLMLGIPLIGPPVLAQEAPPSDQPAEVEEMVEETVVEEPVLVQPVVEQPRVLISEVVIEGIEGHPEEERLQISTYDAMQVRPGMRVTREELQNDLNGIQATGWFSDVRIVPQNGPLGVQVIVQVAPFPSLSAVEINADDEDLLPDAVVEETFASDYGRTLNLNDLQQRMKTLQTWMSNEGYSLARVSGPERVSPEGVVTLKLLQGSVSGVEVKFLTKEGDDTDEKGNPIGGKTKEWVITREVSIQPGDPFNRNQLERDIKRLYGTQLFSDVKVTLRPVPEEPGDVVIVLGIVEQSTGQLSGGLGYSQSQGVFGQVQVQETNLFGRAWNLGLNITYGQYGGLANLNFSDPWIYGDQHRTSFRTSVFLSQQVPQVFQSEDNGNIRTAKDFADNDSNKAYETGRRYGFTDGDKAPGSVNKADNEYSNRSWFDYEGDTVVLRKTGGSFSFARPLNGGDPYKDSKWNVLAGMSFAEVRPINFAGDSRPYGVSTNKFRNGKVRNDDVICVSYNCADSNTLVGMRFATTYNNFNNPRNPTSGNFFTAGTEQFIGINNDSPTFNRLRASYTQFFPVNWLKIHKGCRPKPGEEADCPQAIGVQVKGGAIMGEAPPYEAFCMGGSNSIRGWYDCDLAVSKAFSELTIEYRFPLISILSGEVFMDAGTDFGTQKDVPGKPGLLLDKDGSGVSLGTGVIVTTPVGPIRLEVASKDFASDWRFNLGVGWKF